MIFQYIAVAIIIIVVIVYVVLKVVGFKEGGNSGSTTCTCCSLKEQCVPDKRKDLKKCDQDIVKSKGNN